MISEMEEYLNSILKSPEKIKELNKKGSLNYEKGENDSKITGIMALRNKKLYLINAILVSLKNNDETISIYMHPKEKEICIVTSEGEYFTYNLRANSEIISSECAKATNMYNLNECQEINQSKGNENFIKKIKDFLKMKKELSINNKKRNKNSNLDKLLNFDISDLAKKTIKLFERKSQFIKGKSNKKAIEQTLILALEQLKEMKKETKMKDSLLFDKADSNAAIESMVGRSEEIEIIQTK